MQLENLQDRYSPWDSLQNIISIHNQDNEQHPNDNKYVESSIAYRLQEFMNSGEFLYKIIFTLFLHCRCQH